MVSADSGLAYNESGSGDPLILLDWTPWNTTALDCALATRYRVFSLQPPNTTGSARDAAEAVAEIAKAAGLEAYALAGVSLGADVAFRLALLRPGAVSALALASPTCIAPVEPLRSYTPEAMLAHPEDAALPPPDSGRTAVLTALAAQWASADSDAAKLLPDLACATLVIFGQEDRLASRAAGGAWKEQVPNCNVCYVYDAGHAIAVERPEALVNVVMDFIERRETFIVENRSSLINP